MQKHKGEMLRKRRVDKKFMTKVKVSLKPAWWIKQKDLNMHEFRTHMLDVVIDRTALMRPDIRLCLHRWNPNLQHSGVDPNKWLDDWCGQQQVTDSPSHHTGHGNVLNNIIPAPLNSWTMFGGTSGTTTGERSVIITQNLCVFVWLCVSLLCCHSGMFFISRPMGDEAEPQQPVTDDSGYLSSVFSFIILGKSAMKYAKTLWNCRKIHRNVCFLANLTLSFPSKLT